ADLVEDWLREGVSPNEIAILVRRQPLQMTEDLVEELLRRGIPHRIELSGDDALTNDAVATLIFNFIRVVVADRRPDAYAELMRVVARASGSEEAVLRFNSKLKQHLRDTRATVRGASFAKESP